MAAKNASPPASILRPPTIYKASRGNRGKVIRGAEISEAEAVVERKAGRDIVVCGPGAKANRELAQTIENGVGPNYPDPPHLDEGPYALPHFQPEDRPPEGHSFYETEKRKAAKSP